MKKAKVIICELCKKTGYITLQCRNIEQIRNNSTLCPKDFCMIHGGTKHNDCISDKCLGKPKGKNYSCQTHTKTLIWWPLCKVQQCGKTRHNAYLMRRKRTEEAKALLQNSSITIGHAHTNNSVKIVQ